MNRMRSVAILWTFMAVAVPLSAHAGEAAQCTSSGPAAALCLGVKVIVDEVRKGPKGFGPSGEGMKLLHGIGGLFRGGNGPLDQVQRDWKLNQ